MKKLFLLLLLILPNFLFPQAIPDTVDLVSSTSNNQTTNFWVILSAWIGSVSASSIFFFFRGRLLEARKQANQQMTARSIHVPVSIKNIIAGNKIPAIILSMVLSFSLGYLVFMISGENWQDFEFLGPWGIATLLITFGGTIFSFIKISKM